MAMRKPFYVRFIEDDDPKGQGGGGEGKKNESTDKVYEHGYPKETPVAEMSDKEQAAYWKYHARQHESKAKSREDYDDLKALADKWRAHENESKTPDQKAIDQAKEEARAEERRKIAPRLVRAEFKAQGVGIDKDLLDAFLEDADHTKYLTADGEVDADKVKARVEKLTPKQQQQQRRDNHQGFRKSPGATGIDGGKSLYESRHKKVER